MNDEEYLKWIMPSIKNRSISVSNFRFKKAEEQARMATLARKDIIKYVNEFLKKINMKTTQEMSFNPEVLLENGSRKIKYAEIAKHNKLDDKRDRVWMTLTKGGYISVIGTGCDISFSTWAEDNTTAGLINKYLKSNPPKEHCSYEFEWDNSLVLIFPLKKIPGDLNRSDIESGIGNYLIYKKVPILDFYSHNY